MLFAEILSYGELIYFINSNAVNLNLETLIGTSAWQNKLRKKFIINSGVTIGSNSVNSAALIIPSGLGSSITLINKGSILGAGGSPGTTLSPNGGNGGAAIGLAAGIPTVYIDNQNKIYGGGGGGGVGYKGNDGFLSSNSNFQYFNFSAVSLELIQTYNGSTGGIGGSPGRGEGYQQTSTNGTNGLAGNTPTFNSRTVNLSSNNVAYSSISIPPKTSFNYNYLGNLNTGIYTLRLGYGCTSSIYTSNGQVDTLLINYNASNRGIVNFNGFPFGARILNLTKDPNQPLSPSAPNNSRWALGTTITNQAGGISWLTGNLYPPDTHGLGGTSPGSSWVYMSPSPNGDGITNMYWPSVYPPDSVGNTGGSGGNGGAYGQNGQDGGSYNPGGGGTGGGTGGLAGLTHTTQNVVWITEGDRRGSLP